LTSGNKIWGAKKITKGYKKKKIKKNRDIVDVCNVNFPPQFSPKKGSMAFGTGQYFRT
jgi:hypothetical protein